MIGLPHLRKLRQEILQMPQNLNWTYPGNKNMGNDNVMRHVEEIGIKPEIWALAAQYRSQ